jgi:hypothetical protein
MKTIDLTEYGRRIYQSKNSPHILDEISIELCSWYAYYAEKLIHLELQEAKFWQDNKHLESEKPTSDAMIKKLWILTPEGAEHLQTEMIVKTIEKLLSTLKTSVYRSNIEYRNPTN